MELSYPVPDWLVPRAPPPGSPRSPLSRLSTPRSGPLIPHPSMWALRRDPSLPVPPTPRPKPRDLPDLDIESLSTSDAPCTRPAVDAVIAVPVEPTLMPILTWDLVDSPLKALNRSDNQAMSLEYLQRNTLHLGDGGAPLTAIVLVLSELPSRIEVTHLRAPSSSTSSDSTALPVTLWDVLEGLYRGLRAPISDEELGRLTDSERETLLRAARERYRRMPGYRCAIHPVRRIDFLAARWRFLGIRPALRCEAPVGRSLDEVFVVEVAAGDLSFS